MILWTVLRAKISKTCIIFKIYHPKFIKFDTVSVKKWRLTRFKEKHLNFINFTKCLINLLSVIVPTKVFCLIHNNHHYSWKQVLQYINMINTSLSRKVSKNFKNFQSYYVQCQQSILWILTFLLGLLNSWYFLIHKDTSHHFFFHATRIMLIISDRSHLPTWCCLQMALPGSHLFQ